MKSHEKKMVGVLIAIFCVIIVILLIIRVRNKNEKEQGQSYIQSDQSDQQTTQQLSQMQEESKYKEFEYLIESNSDNKIEKDGIEAQKIYIKSYEDELEIKTTIKNNSSERINGYMIEIDLLDADGNVLTTISENSTEGIDAGESKEMINYVVGLEKQEQIRNAKITSFDKSSLGDSIDREFENMKPEEIKEIENTENK